MRVSPPALITALLLTALYGCGPQGEPPTPPVPDGTPKEQIAETVNEMFRAWNRGDGPLACGYMTPRGQRLAVRIARQLPALRDRIEPDDCVEAIEQTAAATAKPIGQRVTARRVTVTGRRGSVASRFRGALAVKRQDGIWLVDVPAFID